MVAPVSPNETRPLLLQQEHETLAAIADCHELKPREPEPDAAKELQTLLALVYPVVGTTALEFLPGPTSIVLAGHMDSPYTQQYVDAATLSTMVILSPVVRMAPSDMIRLASTSKLDEEISKLAQTFSRWMLLGMPFVVLYELVRKVLQAQNIMKPLVTIATIGNVVNIVTGQWWSGWNFKEAVAHVVFLRLGVPGCLMMTMEWFAFELLTLMAGVLPNAVVSISAHSVLVNINSIIYMVFAGLAVAVNIRVGNCLGANLPKLAMASCTVALTLTLAISLSFIAFLYATRWTLPSLLLNDQESITRAASALAVWAPFEILDGQNTVPQGVFRGAGKQTVDASINAVAYYIFGTPLAVWLGFYWALDVEGLWVGFGLGILVSASCLYFLLFERWTWEELAEDAQKRTSV
ncbi:hypothetical protein PC116_g16877 [Phytophthora cactorum]|uniref:Multi antimicrobial extrusion protein n=1 Tax=Phytophthora cactorum TaxID=29920 RepID=A0A8T1ELM4_9STRA|nr:hypothetical protein PC112_g15925 [Phytophthora cactorum]KAG2851263.1 hypothetical protein PC113_g16074 [Phytophthora cactorum]KAG2954450.1 hypothetical protein PC117_g1155 [Phytophthora cactorum]KAG3037906.1 hypothetical protein PC119_g3255 [Phytophthora cactorum]KAG3055290.1 hypothetical protein PC122_g21758 [Phytophthora cactorum]